jgi:hypothetical protein
MARVDIAASGFSAAAGEELLEALEDRWWYEQYSAGVLKALWLAKVKQDGYALEHAPEELRNDREIVLAAVKQHGEVALNHASEELRNDRDIKQACKK